MLPINQVILGGTDPLLNTGSLTDQIQYDEVEVADVYVAINAQYHDYCELFEKWFGKGNFDDMIFESAISFWFDDIDFGEDKLWKYFNELK